MLLATICLFNMLKLLQLDYFKRRKKIGRKSLKKVEIEGMRLTKTPAGIHGGMTENSATRLTFRSQYIYWKNKNNKNGSNSS